MKGGRTMVMIILVEFLGDPYHPLGGLLAFFGGFGLDCLMKVAALRLGCNFLSFM